MVRQLQFTDSFLAVEYAIFVIQIELAIPDETRVETSTNLTPQYLLTRDWIQEENSSCSPHCPIALLEEEQIWPTDADLYVEGPSRTQGQTHLMGG